MFGFLFFTPLSYAANLWTYQQDFEGLNLGDLNGQDSWVVSRDSVDVVLTGSPYEGAKHAKLTKTSVGVSLTRSFSDVPYGTLYFAFKLEGTTAGLNAYMSLIAGEENAFLLNFAEDYNLMAYNHGVFVDTGIDYAADTYYKISIRFECTAGAWEALPIYHWQFNINDGDWSDVYGFSTEGAAINGINFHTYNTTAYLDFFGYPSPLSPPTISYLSIPVASSTDLFSAVGNMVSDLWSLISIAMGVPLAFYVIPKVIALL